jgi:hypothetical protein
VTDEILTGLSEKPSFCKYSGLSKKVTKKSFFSSKSRDAMKKTDEIIEKWRENAFFSSKNLKYAEKNR